jgi:cobaltochelatase CobT
MNTLTTAIEKIGKILARNHNIMVVAKGDRCCTDGRTIYLPSIADDLSHEVERTIAGFLDHEVSHILNSDFEVIPAFKEKNGLQAFDLLNAIEDYRVNKAMSELYIGSGLNIKAANTHALERLSEINTLSPWQKLTLSICTRLQGLDSSIFGPEADSVVDTLKDELDQAQYLTSTQDSADLAEKILEKLNQMQDEEPKPEPEPQPEDKGNEDNSERGAEGETNSDPSDNPKEGPVNASIEPQDALSDTESDTEPSICPVTTVAPAKSTFLTEAMSDDCPMGDPLAELIQEELNTLPSSTWRVYDPTLDKIIKPKAKDMGEYDRMYSEIRPYLSGLTQKLCLMLQSKRAIRWIGDQECGQINSSRLAGLITGTSTRVFKTKHQEDALNTAITLLIDSSGSMRGDRIQLSSKIAVAFCETLEKLQIKTEVLTFTTESSNVGKYVDQAMIDTQMSAYDLRERYTRFLPLYMQIIKSFDEPLAKCRGRFSKIESRKMHLTPLHEPLLITAKRVATLPEPRKIIFVLTDGVPELAECSSSLMVEEAIKTVQKINKAGIETIGIGIMTDSVRDIFPFCVEIKNIEDLPKGFFRELNRILAN